MASAECSSVIPSYRAKGGELHPTVVYLHGEHDVGNAAALAATLAQVISGDDADVILDLSDVQFMSGATIEVIVRASEFLEERNRQLSLRAPSRCAERLVSICGLDSLVSAGSG